jgi:hypothetical protein
MSRDASGFKTWGPADGAFGARLRPRRQNRRKLQPAVFELDTRLLLSTILVRNTSDNPNNTKSLRYAVEHAASGSTIKFAPNVTGTITLTNGQLDITKNLVIQGPGAGKLAISGNNATRIFAVESGVTATIRGLTITDGNESDDYGGGLYNRGKLKLKNCTFSNDKADNYGGGVYDAPGGTVSLTNCTFSNDTSAGDGGGLAAYDGTMNLTGCSINNSSAGGSYYGGGVYNYGGTVTLKNSTFTGDTAGEGGGGVSTEGNAYVTNCTFANDSCYEYYGEGGGLYNYNTVTLTKCTFTGDKRGGDGAGVYNYDNAFVTNCTFDHDDAGGISNGGGFYNNGDGVISGSTFSNDHGVYGGGLYFDSHSSGSVENCTVADNAADATGGGLFVAYTAGQINVISSTFTGNSAGSSGGGMEIDNAISIKNTIVAGNTAFEGPDFYSTHFDAVNSLGHNLIGNSSDSEGNWGSTDLTEIRAQPLDLGSLGNYGGPTQTIAVLPGSVAIGNGTAANGAPSTDQRGVARPAGNADIGAFQDRGFTIVLFPESSPQSAKVNTPFGNPLTAVVSSLKGDPVIGGSIAFTVPSSGATANLSANTAPIGAFNRATVTATANGTIGNYRVFATARGAINLRAFILTNRGQATRIATLALARGERAQGIESFI